MFTRRTVLGALAACGVVNELVRADDLPPLPDAAARPARDAARRLFSSSAEAAVIGHAYLESNPHEARSTQRLYSELFACDERTGTPDVIQARRRLATRVHNDFRLGRTVVVEGWIVSRTEALACALVAMT